MKARVMQAGVFAFFLKPFDDDQFLDRVHQAFGPVVAGKENQAQPSGGRD